MNVVYDLLGFQSRDHGERGIARYVLNLALGLERTRPGLVTQYLMHPEMPLPAGAEPLIATGRVVRADQPSPVRAPSTGGIFVAPSLFEMLGKPLDVVLPRWARAPQWRKVGVLYDLIPLRFPHIYLSTTADRHSYESRVATVAGLDHVLTISEASAADAVELAGVERRRLTVIGAGADQRFRRPLVPHHEVASDLAASGDVPGLRPGYVLFPSGIEPRKNIERTIEAYASLPARRRQQHQLVLVCRLNDDGRRYLTDLLHAVGVADEVLATGFVEDGTLARLYQGAELVIFPSLYEGFGLPVLEAMQSGAPVICSDTSSLIEVQPRPDARFDPTSVPSIAAAMEHALGDQGFRDDLRVQPLPPFSWEHSAQATAAVLDDLSTAVSLRGGTAATPVTPAAPSTPRLALLTPLPPQQSGIATYSYRLLTELRHHCRVTVFTDTAPDGSGTDGTDLGGLAVPDGVEVERIDRFDLVERGGGAFDQVLYFMGNSRFHIEMLDLLNSRGGTVLFHDVRLTSLYNEQHRLVPDRLIDGSVGATLESLYPHRYRPSLVARETIPADLAHRFGVYLAREVADAADDVLVHSSFAGALLGLDTGARSSVVFPLPCPPVDAGSRVEPAGPPVIATFGLVAPVKQPDTLIDALAVVRGQVPDARLRFVGGIDPDYRDDLFDLVSGYGPLLDGAVEIVGHLDAAAYNAARNEATVAVQLRAFSNGESSASVADLLAGSVPTVVNDLGAMAELPDDVVAKVSPSTGPDELGQLLIELLTDPARRQALSGAAQDYARANSYAEAASILAKTLFG